MILVETFNFILKFIMKKSFENLKVYSLIVLGFLETERDIFLLNFKKIVHRYYKNNLIEITLYYFYIFVNF